MWINTLNHNKKRPPERFTSDLDFMPQIKPIIKIIKDHIESTICSYTVSDQRWPKDIAIFNKMMSDYHLKSLTQFDVYISSINCKINQNHWFETTISNRYQQYITPNIINDNAASLEEFNRMIQYLEHKRTSIEEIINTKAREAFMCTYLEMMFAKHNKGCDFQLYPTSMREDIMYGSDYLLFITNEKNYITVVPIDLKTHKKITKIVASEKERVGNPQYYYLHKYSNIVNAKHPIQRNILLTRETEYNIIERYIENLNKDNCDTHTIYQWFEQAFEQNKIFIPDDQQQLNQKQFDISTRDINFKSSLPPSPSQTTDLHASD